MHFLPSSGSTYKFRVVAVNMYGEGPHSFPSKLYQVPQASPRMADRPVVGPHISSTDAISDTQIMLRWTVSTVRISQEMTLFFITLLNAAVKLSCFVLKIIIAACLSVDSSEKVDFSPCNML